ncbi:HAD family hydrolase [Oceanobacillus longus]|uniref:HAD family hydrolase n=1 Tax=Oceanobacillus longus TaxID=930120 RepID=A0ABV8GZ26_9BACI
MNIKAIALDMDGTLLNDENKVDEHLVKLIGKIRSRDIRVFIATGRTKLEINDVLPDDLHVDGFVTANGMSCYTNTKAIVQHTLQAELLKDVVSRAREKNLYYEIHPKDGIRFAKAEDRAYLEAEVNKTRPDTLLNNEYKARQDAIRENINWVENLTFENIVKVYFFSMNPESIDDWKNTLYQIKKQTDFSLSSSSLHNVEIMVSNVSKATALNMLLQEYDISNENLMVVGDGENDLPMFELAAYSVAMQNAEEVVKEKADEVTIYTYRENGLYEYLARKFKEKA